MTTEIRPMAGLKLVPAILPLLLLPLIGSPADPPVPKPGKALVIDTHMHVWADDAKKFPFDHPYEPKFMPPKLAASVERLVEEMDANGITHCVLVQTIYHGWDNRYLAHCLKAHPARFRGQALIEPTDPNVADKFGEVMKVPGMTGVRLSPIYYKGKDGWLDVKASAALWKKTEELGAVLNFFIAPEQLPKLEAIVKQHPKLKVVIDHLARVEVGGEGEADQTKKLLALAKYPNVYVKVSELSEVSASKKYPYKDAFPLVKAVYEAFSADRLLWGTGFPGATRAQAERPTLEQELALIRKEIPFFSDEDRAKILGQNAAKLWGLADAKKGK